MNKKFLIHCFLFFVISPFCYADKQACLNANNNSDPKTIEICTQALLTSDVSIDDQSIINITQASYLIRNNKFNEANQYLDLAFNRNPKMLENGIFRYNWLRTKGTLYYNKDEYLTSLPFFEQALEVAQIMGNRAFMANSFNDLGAVYLDLDKYHQSLEWSQKSLKIHYELNDDYRIALTLANIAEIYLMLEENQKALEYFNLSLDSHKNRQAKNPEQNDFAEQALAKVHKSIGQLYIKLNNPDQALENLQLALTIYQKYQLKGQQVSVLAVLGEMYLEQNNVDKALTFLQQAMQIEATLESQDNLELKNHLINAYIASSQWQLAEKTGLQSLQQAKSKSNKDAEADFLSLLSIIYQKTGDLNQAIEYLKEAQLIKESLLEQKYHESRGKLLAEIELEQKKQELSKLEESQIIGDLNNSRKILVFIILAFLLLMVIGYLLFRLNRKGKIQKNMLFNQTLHTNQLAMLSVKKENIELLFDGLDCQIICFDTAGKIHYNSPDISVLEDVQELKMQTNFPDIWQLLLPHIDEDENLKSDLFFDKGLSNSIPGGVWIHQMNFLDDILVCLFIGNQEDNAKDFINAENIRKYTEFKQQLSDFFICTKDFPIKKIPQLKQASLAMKAVNTNAKTTSVAFNEGEDFKRILVDLMITCLEIWQQASSKSNIELAEKSGLWLVSIEEGQLRTRTMDKYTDIKKISDNPRWRQVVKTAHFVLSNCELNIKDRQLLNDKTEAFKKIIRDRAIGY